MPENKSPGHKEKVFVFEIKEPIEPPIWHKTRKAFAQAANVHADVILIHMNTYGGMLESADSIRTTILQSKIPVWVFIDNNAASAGALIALACDSIYMRRGGSIGAASVVNQNGEKMPEKYQSYMRSMMRSTAEARGRNPLIAQAMVEPLVSLPGIADSGKVLTFTASEAVKNHYCQGIAEDVQGVIRKAGIDNFEVVELDLSFIDLLIAFLVNPVVSGILIMIIVAGIYFEFQSPGAVFPIILAALAASLYFAPLYLEGLASHWEILLFVIGVILVAIEIFAIPGFGIIGFTGIIAVILGLTLSLLANSGFDFSNVSYSIIVRAFLTVISSFFISIVGSIYVSKKLFTTNLFGQLALSTVQTAGEGYITANKQMNNLVGREGLTATILRPAGKVEIDNDIFDALAETGYIDKGCDIYVTRYEGSNLIVRKKI